jgi:hypothetical protein
LGSCIRDSASQLCQALWHWWCVDIMFDKTPEEEEEEEEEEVEW